MFRLFHEDQAWEVRVIGVAAEMPLRGEIDPGRFGAKLVVAPRLKCATDVAWVLNGAKGLRDLQV